LNILHVPTPIGSKQFAFDIAMEAAVGPVRYARDVSMLHWIEMNVVDVALKIRVIANCVLPIAALPNAFFTFAYFACGSCPWVKAS
jgi:hypothetical protein